MVGEDRPLGERKSETEGGNCLRSEFRCGEEAFVHLYEACYHRQSIVGVR